jgi:hypothetical protein
MGFPGLTRKGKANKKKKSVEKPNCFLKYCCCSLLLGQYKECLTRFSVFYIIQSGLLLFWGHVRRRKQQIDVLTNLGGFGLGKWYVEPYDVRIACGSNQDLYASNGFKWAKDFGYTAGSSANLTVKNTLVPMLNTLRYFQISDGPENCYNISVPVGHYLIRFFIIHFFVLLLLARIFCFCPFEKSCRTHHPP